MAGPSNLCNRLGQIIGGTETLSISGVCEVISTRTFPLFIQGIKVRSPITKNIAFVFQSMDSSDVALCLGQITLLEKELTFFISQLLTQKNILVGSISTFYIKSNPSIVTLNIESLEKPVIFSLKVSKALKRAKIKSIPTRVGLGDSLCNRIAQIIHPSARAITLDGICTVVISRKSQSKVLGRINHANTFIFNMEPIDNKGNATCFGRLWLYENEINTVVRRVKQKHLEIGSVNENFIFSNPRSYYLTFQSIENPLSFAKKVSEVIKGLV